jgi:hypothetical protein
MSQSNCAPRACFRPWRQLKALSASRTTKRISGSIERHAVASRVAPKCAIQPGRARGTAAWGARSLYAFLNYRHCWQWDDWPRSIKSQRRQLPPQANSLDSFAFPHPRHSSLCLKTLLLRTRGAGGQKMQTWKSEAKQSKKGS